MPNNTFADFCDDTPSAVTIVECYPDTDGDRYCGNSRTVHSTEGYPGKAGQEAWKAARYTYPKPQPSRK